METAGSSVDTRDGETPADPVVDLALARIKRNVFGTPVEPARVGRFVLLRELGRGGMGVVYEAYDPALDRKIAIKLLRLDRAGVGGEERARLVREAQALARLSHPNVVPVFEVGATDDADAAVFVAMERVHGVTVRRWLAETPRDWREITRVFVEAARGVAAAHAAGLVHRDLKPDNIMVGDDGRVRVLDFGLARGAGDRDEPGGAVAGTPAYMAPEQLRGDPVDARADQFGLCAALFECLWGTRPFAGDTLTSVRTAIERGRVVDVAPVRAVPQRIRAIVLRGLDPDPLRRWPDLAELAQALERRAKRRSRAFAIAALVGCGALAWSALGVGRLDRCATPERELAGVWDETRSEAIAAAFATSGVNDAGAIWARVQSDVDAHARAWGESWQEVCQAERVRADDALERRAACLDQRLHELRALADALTRADAVIVREAPKAVQAMSSIAGCNDDDALVRGLVPPPRDPWQRAAVLRARERLADAGGLLALAQFEPALAIAEEVDETARTIGHAPLEAEALLMHGRLAAKLGRLHDALPMLERAVGKAIEGDHAEALAMAASELTYLEGYQLARAEAGERWAAIASAAVARADRDGLLEAQRLQNLGSVRLAAGDVAGGLAAFRRALGLAEAALGPDHPRVAGLRSNIATALRLRGELDAALEELARARAVLEAALGPDHPDVALVVAQMANAHQSAGRNADALAGYDRALEIYAASMSGDHPNTATLLMNSGVALTSLGRLDEALERLERARSLVERRLGADHPQVAQVVHDVGLVYQAQGDLVRARETFADALARKERVHGPDHLALATSLRTLALVRARLGEDARPMMLRALAIYEQSGQHDPRERLEALRELTTLELWTADRAAAPRRP